MKEKTYTWNKSCKEGAKRAAELKMVEAAVMNGKKELTGKGMIRDLPEQFPKTNEVEHEARTEVSKWNGSWTEISWNT